LIWAKTLTCAGVGVKKTHCLIKNVDEIILCLI